MMNSSHENYFEILSDEVIVEILSYINYHELFKVASVCQRWWSLSKDYQLINILELNAKVRLQCTLRNHTRPVRCLQEWRSYLWVGADDKNVSVWEKGGTLKSVLTQEGNSSTNSCVPWNDVLYAACGSGMIDKYTLDSNSNSGGTKEDYPILVGSFKAHSTLITCLKIWQGNLYSGGFDGKVHVWDKQLNLIRKYHAHNSPVRVIQDWDDLLYSAGDDKFVVVYNSEGLIINQLKLDDINFIMCMIIWNDRLYIGCYGPSLDTIQVWEREKIKGWKKQVQSNKENKTEDSMNTIQNSIEGEEENEEEEEDEEEEEEEEKLMLNPKYIYRKVHCLMGHDIAVDALFVWRDRLFSGGRDGTIRVWNSVGTCLQIIKSDSAICTVSYWNDNIVAGCFDGTIQVYTLHGLQTVLKTSKRKETKKRILKLSNSSLTGS